MFMAEQYLRCKYYEDTPMITFSNEYLITFKIKNMNKVNPSALIEGIEFPARDEEWCIVGRGSVVSMGNNERLVKLLDLKMNEVKDEALVAISNLDGISCFSVPMGKIEVR